MAETYKDNAHSYDTLKALLIRMLGHIPAAFLFYHSAQFIVKDTTAYTSSKLLDHPWSQGPPPPPPPGTCILDLYRAWISVL